MYIQDLQALVLYAAGKTESEVENFEDDIWEFCEEHFGVNLDEFEHIAECLLKLTPLVSSPLSNKFHHAFLHRKGMFSTAIVKEKHIES